MCYNDIVPTLLPNADQARIDSRKLRDYALNPQHESGRYKSNWFRLNPSRGERENKMDKSLALLDTVIATTDFPENQVLNGDLGTIVEVYTNPALAYEVEFVNPDGSTRALLTLTPTQVRRLSRTDVITTRPLSVAA